MKVIMSERFPDRISNFKMSENEYRNFENNYSGLCLACGYEQDGVEPDACSYNCDQCDEEKVFGVPELLLMGRIRF